MDPATTEDGAPAAKRARIETDLGWAASFGKKQDPSASAASGGWALRNWTQEKQAEQPPKPASEEEDWSFFHKDDSAASASSNSSSSSSSSSVSSFKVPQGRAKRVSFAEEVKIVTIPKVSAEGGEAEEELEEIADFLDEPEEEDGASGGDAPLRLASSEAGAEGLIDYLLSAIPVQGQKKTKNAKYFAKAKIDEEKSNEQQPRPPKAPKKRLDDLDEDSFLEAFIDHDATTPPSQSIPVEEAGKEKKAKKKPTFKF